MKIGLGWIFLLIDLVLLSVVFVPTEKIEQVGMIELCRDITEGSIASPSSYTMQSAAITMGVGAPETGATKTKDEALKQQILSGEKPYRTATVIISQQANDVHGVLQKSQTDCQFSILGDVKYGIYRIDSVEIDGKKLSKEDIFIASKGGESSIGDFGYFKKGNYLLYLATSKI